MKILSYGNSDFGVLEKEFFGGHLYCCVCMLFCCCCFSCFRSSLVSSFIILSQSSCELHDKTFVLPRQYQDLNTDKHEGYNESSDFKCVNLFHNYTKANKNQIQKIIKYVLATNIIELKVWIGEKRGRAVIRLCPPPPTTTTSIWRLQNQVIFIFFIINTSGSLRTSYLSMIIALVNNDPNVGDASDGSEEGKIWYF